MEQQNNIAGLNDSAGVLPMDTGASVNGIHDDNEKTPSLAGNSSAKKGRGRPPKSAGSVKVSVVSDMPKRARGRPAKTEEILPMKKVAVPKQNQEVVATNGDASKKKRGRPSKGNATNEHVNGISKPQVQSTPVSVPQTQEPVDSAAKKKRGRPAGASPKKVVVVASPSKETSPAKKRGRPSGTAGVKKPVSKPTATASTDGSARKRGRPKKSSATSTVAPSPDTETATVPADNV